LVAQGQTDDSGRVSFDALPIGYLSLVITGSDGNNYHVPVQVNKDTMSRTRVLVFRVPATGKIFLSAKTIHDADGDGVNDDSFSYAVFNRPRNSSEGGTVHLHLEGETKIDGNGDGDFTDPEDKAIIEPDDDGISSDAGDGDEDNDGLLDNVDPDIDGDGLLNENDPDIDGDGLLNADDPYPYGITPSDDFIPPGLPQGAIYPGVSEVAQIDTGTVSVFFPTGIDDKNPPVTYIIYYSTTSPLDFKTAPKKIFRPLLPGAPDSVLSDNVINLITGQTYYFAVRAMDSAQPPNIDHNVNEMSITIEPWS